MQHEFRTPLSTCINFLEAILSQDIPAEVKKHVQLVLSQLCLLLNLVQGLLDLKAGQENRFVPRMVLFDPAKVFEEIIQLFKF